MVSFFKKVPFRQAHPAAKKEFDGYYSLVPRHHRYNKDSPGGETIARIARQHRITFDEAIMKVQRECDRRAAALVAERRVKNEKRKVKSRKRRAVNLPQYVTAAVRTTTRDYESKRTNERQLVRETVRVERVRLLEADYRAFPLPFALSIHRAGGEGLSVSEEVGALSEE